MSRPSTSATTRMLWSSSVPKSGSQTVNGHVYVISHLPFDAPAADVSGLVAVGAVSIAQSGPADKPSTGSGPAALNRPSTATAGALYYDTDLQRIIVSDGDYWRRPDTGEIVHCFGQRTGKF